MRFPSEIRRESSPSLATNLELFCDIRIAPTKLTWSVQKLQIHSERFLAQKGSRNASVLKNSTSEKNLKFYHLLPSGHLEMVALVAAALPIPRPPKRSTCHPEFWMASITSRRTGRFWKRPHGPGCKNTKSTRASPHSFSFDQLTHTFSTCLGWRFESHRCKHSKSQALPGVYFVIKSTFCHVLSHAIFSSREWPWS